MVKDYTDIYPKVLRFDTKEDCEAFIAEHEILARPHDGIDGRWIAVFSDARGVFAASSPTTAELLADW